MTESEPSVFDMVPVISDPRRSRVRRSHPFPIEPQNPCAAIVKRTIKLSPSLFRFRGGMAPDPRHQGKVLVYAETRNQEKALEPIISARPADVLFCSATAVTFRRPDVRFDRGRAWFAGLARSWRIVRDARTRSTRFQRLTLRCDLARYILALGAYYEWRRLLKRWRPRAVLVSNDYNHLPRTLLLAARALDVSTFYIPHALVGCRHFTPPVPVADTLFLANGLERERIEERVELSRAVMPDMRIMSRYVWVDDGSSNRKSMRSHKIGVSVNRADDPDVLRDVITNLRTYFPWLRGVILRPHPSLSCDGWNPVVERVPFSVEIHSGILSDYFSRIDAHVAGATMMHLEAVRFGVPTMFLPGAEARDHYGFAQAKIASPLSPDMTREKLDILRRQQRLDADGLLGDEKSQQQEMNAAASAVFAKESLRDCRSSIHVSCP